MALTAPPIADRKRVKVYELKNNDWFDRGTGFCTGSMVNVSLTRPEHDHLACHLPYLRLRG
jgi:hypothetical protein